MIGAALLLTLAAAAQDHQNHQGHQMPADPHAGHAMPPATDPHAGHRMPPARETAPEPAVSEARSGTDLGPGSAPAPAPPSDRYADRFWPAGAMAASRDKLHREHGAMAMSMLALNIAEWQPASDGDRFRWDGEGWWGGDIHRLTVKTEGEARVGEAAEAAEVQALYSRALDAYWNLQAGVRQDLGRGPRRTYATIGVEGLAPYWFDVEGALFLSDRGDVLARVEAYYDQRLTQRLILQPRLEVEAAAQDMPANRIGRGLGHAALDLRLRYEIAREFAPYVGVAWERSFGRTADDARAAGEDRSAARFALGVRAWF
jgi:copper resistance protein B